MKGESSTLQRMLSIQNTYALPYSVTGIPVFDLKLLGEIDVQEFSLPDNIRLGHLAERVVSQLIDLSSEYDLRYENIQLIEDKNTIGELDFIIQEKRTKQVIHLEMAYKFYLYDPKVLDSEIENWIGPNRNDSLHKKLEKLKQKQFPLLYHPIATEILQGIDVDQACQALCLLTSLYLPYDYKKTISAKYTKALKGYYLNLETLISLDNDSKSYFLPARKSWGIDPSSQKFWNSLNDVKLKIKEILRRKQSVLCWIKEGDTFKETFVVWW